MSKNVTIQFKSLPQLWQFAQAINARFIEIRTEECLLNCDCSEADLQMVEQYEGKLLMKEHAENN